MRQPLWYLAVSAFALLTLSMLFSPVRAEAAAVQLGDITFSWAHVLGLTAVAAAWGDMRSQNRQSREDIKAIKDELKEMRKRED
jgi:hypothetical protein